MNLPELDVMRAANLKPASQEDDVPDTADYLDHIRELARGRDPLGLQSESPRVLTQLISNSSEEQLTTRPATDKWSVGEILAHLAEDEIATAWRYRQMVEHSGVELAGFDQDLWARIGDYSSRVPQDSLELFRLLRSLNLQFLQKLTPGQWECYGIHAERGRITVKELAMHMAGHDANHIAQIKKILR